MDNYVMQEFKIIYWLWSELYSCLWWVLITNTGDVLCFWLYFGLKLTTDCCIYHYTNNK